MERKDVEIDLNKLIYNPLLKAVYMVENDEKYAGCAKEKEEYRNCLIKMQQSGRRKWTKKCFKFEESLLRCINGLKLQRVEEQKKEVQAKQSKVKIGKPNDALLKEMEEQVERQRKITEETKKKYKKQHSSHPA